VTAGATTMPAVTAAMRARSPTALRRRDPAPSVATIRQRLTGAAVTTLHVAAFPLGAVDVRVARLDGSESLVRWCRRAGVAHAIVGGAVDVPFDAPWDGERACLQIAPEGIAIARRPDLPAHPRGDLLQAGPLLVRDGFSVVTDGDDEGFTAGAHQFDSDISDGRHPRCALALTDDSLLAVACDGRHPHDAGLTLGELAGALVGFGARSALNLDGGGSASLVCDGRLVNRPREQHGLELLKGRRIATALALELRG
jgi:hypothetical protein